MGLMEDLKKQARETEAETETALNRLNDFLHNLEADGLEVSDGQTLPEEKMYPLVERGLEKLKTIAGEMTTEAKSTVDQAQAKRLADIHRTFAKDFQKTKASLTSRRERSKLFGKAQPKTDEEYTGLLLRENRSLESSLTVAKNILDQAGHVKDSLDLQKQRLQGTSEKVVRFAETLPGINVLLNRISRRHKFNALVIGLALAVCMCITFIYLF